MHNSRQRQMQRSREAMNRLVHRSRKAYHNSRQRLQNAMRSGGRGRYVGGSPGFYYRGGSRHRSGGRRYYGGELIPSSTIQDVLASTGQTQNVAFSNDPNAVGSAAWWAAAGQGSSGSPGISGQGPSDSSYIPSGLIATTTTPGVYSAGAVLGGPESPILSTADMQAQTQYIYDLTHPMAQYIYDMQHPGGSSTSSGSTQEQANNMGNLQFGNVGAGATLLPGISSYSTHDMSNPLAPAISGNVDLGAIPGVTGTGVSGLINAGFITPEITGSMGSNMNPIFQGPL